MGSLFPKDQKKETELGSKASEGGNDSTFQCCQNTGLAEGCRANARARMDDCWRSCGNACTKLAECLTGYKNQVTESYNTSKNKCWWVTKPAAAVAAVIGIPYLTY